MIDTNFHGLPVTIFYNFMTTTVSEPISVMRKRRQRARNGIGGFGNSITKQSNLISLFRFLPGHPRFFLGTDSAPHPRSTKEAATSNAGVFTSPYVLPYLAHILDGLGALDKLQAFACENGRKFYGISGDRPQVKLVKRPFKVPDELPFTDDEGKKSSVVPFLAGKELSWSIEA